MQENKQDKGTLFGGGQTTFSGQVTINRYINNVQEYHEAAEVNGACDYESLRQTIDSYILPFIKNQRGWFGFAKAVMQRKMVGDGDFGGVERLLMQIYPEGIPCGFNARDLSSLNAGTYVKPIKEWEPSKAGTDGKFPEIQTVALRTLLYFPEL